MKRVITGELRRLFGTRIPAWAAVIALAAGAFFPAVISIVGPENATPPMPGLDTPEGVQIVLGIAGLTLFLPALLGVFAVAGEYQHRTIVTTFITAPRRGTVLVAKLLVYAFAGLGYGILLAASTGAVLLLHAGISGTPLGLAPADLARDLAGVALAAVAYTAIGVAVGAITRNLLLAAGIVLGWFYLIEPMIMLIPGINTAYPLLPGGATASLVGFTFLTDAMSAQLHLSGPSILSPWVGALVLFVYAAVAAAIAFVLPLRRDIA
jgi:ABC-type transport system involved in multi-copper enzyme maturation permease subunit